MAAPTEAEIRALLDARRAAYPLDGGDAKLDEAIGELFAIIDYRPLDEDEAEPGETATGAEVWTDLRPSEWMRLRELVKEAQTRAKARALEAIVAEIHASAVAFAAEYPDAPRTVREEAQA